MRDIKFRAWKKSDTPEMFTDVNMIDFKKNIIGLDFPISTKTVRTDVESLDNVVLMQYTGKKDINGVEIYESDILACYGGSTDLGYTLQANVEVEDIYEMAFIIRNCDKYEVIGNVYENKDLLED